MPDIPRDYDPKPSAPTGAPAMTDDKRDFDWLKPGDARATLVAEMVAIIKDRGFTPHEKIAHQIIEGPLARRVEAALSRASVSLPVTDGGPVGFRTIPVTDDMVAKAMLVAVATGSRGNELMRDILEAAFAMIPKAALTPASPQSANAQTDALWFISSEAFPVKGSAKFSTDAELAAWAIGVDDTKRQIAEMYNAAVAQPAEASDLKSDQVPVRPEPAAPIAQTEGYKLVPVEPTREMLAAVAFQGFPPVKAVYLDGLLLKPAVGTENAEYIYKAMLAASPSTPEGK